jgi:hypothetical protein
MDPHPITEPASVQAMANLGILYTQLIALRGISYQSVDPDLQDCYYYHHFDRITRLTKQITDARAAILQSAQVQRSSAPAAPGLARPATAQSDRRLAKLEQQHHREVESLVQAVLRSEHQRSDAAAKEVRMQAIKTASMQARAERSAAATLRHLQKIEQQEAAAREIERQREEKRQEQYRRDQARLVTLQRLADAKLQRLARVEELRQSRAVRNRDAIAKWENDRHESLQEKERADNERTARWTSAKQEENDRKAEENHAESERKRKLLEDFRATEEAEMAQKRFNERQTEIERERWFLGFQGVRTDVRNSQRERHDAKAQRFLVQAQVLEQQRYERKVQSVTDEGAADARLAEIERQKALETKLRAYELQLKKEERDENAQRLERLDQARKAKCEKQRQDSDRRIAAMQAYRSQMRSEQEQRSIQMDRAKQEMSANFKEQIAADKASVDSIRVLAAKYGVDVYEVEARSTSRSAPL